MKKMIYGTKFKVGKLEEYLRENKEGITKDKACELFGMAPSSFGGAIYRLRHECKLPIVIDRKYFPDGTRLLTYKLKTR